jgi:hypothetical protein
MSLPPINLHFVSSGATWDEEGAEEGEGGGETKGSKARGEGQRAEGEERLGTDETAEALSSIILEERASIANKGEEGDEKKGEEMEGEGDEGEEEGEEGDEGEEEGGDGLMLQMRGPLPRVASDSATLVYTDDACAPCLVHV